jgi:uncharacterized membrane protein
MAAFAYLLPPVSGFLAYLWGRDLRTRFHGLQAVGLGALTPALLYGASSISGTATRVVGAIAGLLWVLALLAAVVGRDLRVPVIGQISARLVGYEVRASR